MFDVKSQEEYHETCFCTCWPRRTQRGRTIERRRVCADDDCQCAGRLRLQRIRPLLAPPLLWRLLSSALLGWWLWRLAPSLGWLWWRLRRLWLAPPLGRLGRWLRLAPLAPVVLTAERKGLRPLSFLWRTSSLRGATRRSSPSSKRSSLRRHGLLCRGACHRGRIRATRCLAMTGVPH